MRMFIFLAGLLLFASCEWFARKACGEPTERQQAFLDSVNVALEDSLEITDILCSRGFLEMRLNKDIDSLRIEGIWQAAKKQGFTDLYIFDKKHHLLREVSARPAAIISLTNKVFITSAGMDSACRFKELPTDFYQELVFVNDSEFVRTVHTCCGGPGEDLVSEVYYSGNYKVDKDFLILTFNTTSVTSIDHSEGDSTISRLGSQKANFPPLKFESLRCGWEIYFRQIGEDFAGGFVSPKESAAGYIKYFKEEGIWEMVFPAK